MKTKEKQDNILKRWWKLVEPNKGYFAGQIIFSCLYTILLSVITIFAARTINCMYHADWKGAFINLLIEFATIFGRNVFAYIQNWFHCWQCKVIYINVARKLYNKLISCDSEALKNIPKDRVLNICLSNMSHLRTFANAAAEFIGYAVQVVFILVTVFVSNYLAGLIICVLGVVNFFAYYYFNRKMGRLHLQRHEKKDSILATYDKVLTGKAIITESASKAKYEQEVVNDVANYSDVFTKYTVVESDKVTWYYIFWSAIVYAITALLLFFVSKGQMDIAIYLIIVPYLTTCTDKLNTIFDKTNALETMRVDVDRVSIILALNDRQLIKYGKFNQETSGYNLGFIDVSVLDDKICETSGPLKQADISFKMGGVNLIKGERHSGKRTIFELLRRHIVPENGKVLLDNLDLFMYNPKTYKNHINYCASHPTFLIGTIKENFAIVDKNMKNIKKACEKVGILDYIQSLPNKFNTNMNEILSSEMRFLIGLARAILTDCKILIIYETPQDAQPQFIEFIKNFIKTRSMGKTIILFTHDQQFDDVADLIYTVNDGMVEIQK